MHHVASLQTAKLGVGESAPQEDVEQSWEEPAFLTSEAPSGRGLGAAHGTGCGTEVPGLEWPCPQSKYDRLGKLVSVSQPARGSGC